MPPLYQSPGCEWAVVLAVTTHYFMSGWLSTAVGSERSTNARLMLDERGGRLPNCAGTCLCGCYMLDVWSLCDSL